MSGLSDHSGVIFDCSHLGPLLNGGERVNYRLITDAGLGILYNKIENIDWYFVTSNDVTIDQKFNEFINLIMASIEASFPMKNKLKRQGSGGVSVNWFNDKLRDMRGRLQMLVTINKQNPILVMKNMVRDYRNRYRYEISNAKKVAHDSYINRSTNKQVAMWNVIRTYSHPGLDSVT